MLDFQTLVDDQCLELLVLSHQMRVREMTLSAAAVE